MNKLPTVGDILDEMDGATAAPVPASDRVAQFRPDLTPADYFAEPCPVPALTSSGIGTLLTRSPLHFWHEHPALGGGKETAKTAAMYRGSLVHRLALGKGDDFVICDYADWRTNAAKAAKAAAEEAGAIPVLASKYEEALQMADTLRAMIDKACEGLPWEAEMVVTGEWGGIHRRCMVDVWCPDLGLALDIKTAASITDGFLARAFANGYARQAAWYLDLLDAATGNPGRNRFEFLFVEDEAPFLSRTASISEAYLTGARSENLRAERIFARCMAENRWPGPSHFLACPADWKVREWIDEELKEGE
jgi:hypothetical protein